MTYFTNQNFMGRKNKTNKVFYHQAKNIIYKIRKLTSLKEKGNKDLLVHYSINFCTYYSSQENNILSTNNDMGWHNSSI